MQCSHSSVVSLPFLPNLVESLGLSFFQLDLLSLEGVDFDRFSEQEESADLELLLLLVLLDDLLSFFEGVALGSWLASSFIIQYISSASCAFRRKAARVVGLPP